MKIEGLLLLFNGVFLSQDFIELKKFEQELEKIKYTKVRLVFVKWVQPVVDLYTSKNYSFFLPFTQSNHFSIFILPAE